MQLINAANNVDVLTDGLDRFAMLRAPSDVDVEFALETIHVPQVVCTP
jgi:hypothetical protein